MRAHQLVQLEDEGVRQARWVLDRARAAWREHTGNHDRPGCVQCFIVSSRRRVDEANLCPTGRQLRRARDTAAAELRNEREDAARPDPNQATLFDF